MPHNFQLINGMGAGVATMPGISRWMAGDPRRTVVVKVLYRTRTGPGAPERVHTADLLLLVPRGTGTTASEVRSYLETLIEEHYDEFQAYALRMGSDFTSDELVLPDSSNRSSSAAAMEVLSVRHLMTDSDVRAQLGFTAVQHAVPYSRLRLFGWGDQGGYRGFRYLIEGMDLRTLDAMVSNEHIHEDCDRMCMYRMLADRMRRDQGHTTGPAIPKMFLPENVNKWMNENGRGVGGLQDGLTPDDLQAHAQHFRYGHCAMDLTRSVVNLYIPEGGGDKNKKTVAYVVVGDHCQPILDANVIRSVMSTASSRLGQLHNSSGLVGILTPGKSEDQGPQARKRRARSLDRLFRSEYPQSAERQVQESWASDDAPVDMELVDFEEEFEDTGSVHSVRMGGVRKKTKEYPLAHQVDRFHPYEIHTEEGKKFVEDRCKPTAWEGDNLQHWHYFICTDEDDVEFLYEYLVRRLKIDPLRFARTYNGRCRQITMQNMMWIASRDWEMTRQVHGALYPNEPLKLCGMGSYGFRLLHREMFKQQGDRKAHGIWESMSQYPANLAKLMDNQFPTNRPKLLHKNFEAPYTDPRKTPEDQMKVLIPWDERRRMDCIRCYAAALRRIAEDEDQYPIHDITNLVETFDDAKHGHIPIGHYVVKIPIGMDSRWSCLIPGEERVMSHRMVRRFLVEEWLTKADILYVCIPDSIRQDTYGKALCQAFRAVVQLVYQHPALQDNELGATKHVINHLVGLCNGTSLSHSGMRYVFHDLQHCYRLLSSILAEDQLRQIRIWHSTGMDPIWKIPFDYYELDSSGLQHRNFHMQPVYLMVIEEQSWMLYERARFIPLKNLIQFHCDAIEYRYHPSQKWSQDLEKDTVYRSAYDTMKPAQLWEQGLLGRWKQEDPKDIQHARSYFMEFHGTMHKVSQLYNERRLTSLFDATVPVDPVEADTIASNTRWREALRGLDLGEGVKTEEVWKQWISDWYEAGRNGLDRSGLLLTGPAGTGKTFMLKQLYEFGRNSEQRILRTAFTHSACVQLGFDAQTLSSVFGHQEVRMQLIHSRRFAAHLRQLNLDVLMVDEISMIPLCILEGLHLLHKMNGHTRIILGGDFCQLPPVDRQWNRGDDYNFFDETDIFPYLLYDAKNNVQGSWWKLTECMRTDDPLLQAITQNPLDVSNLVTAEKFPMPTYGTPIWRYICWRNATRKAVNWYCMHRYHWQYPTKTVFVAKLKDVYIQNELSKAKNQRFDAQYYEQQYHRGIHRPQHWPMLQDYIYAEGMEVVCRNTLRNWVSPHAASNQNENVNHSVVNNRRARIESIDTVRGWVTLRWMDLIKQADEMEGWNWDDWDVILTYYDFAFNFVPGFCTTTHMAQGETIREHYGILEWDEIRKKSKMAYVASTRGSHSSLLHIVPGTWWADPWGLTDRAGDLTTILSCRLYQNNRFDRENREYPIGAFDALHSYLSQEFCVCQLCKGPLVPLRFHIVWRGPNHTIPSTEWDPLLVVCEPCQKANRQTTVRT
jgi:hypothetical protein